MGRAWGTEELEFAATGLFPSALCLLGESLINPQQSRGQGSLVIPRVLHHYANMGLRGLRGRCYSAHPGTSAGPASPPVQLQPQGWQPVSPGKAGGDPIPRPGPSGEFTCRRTPFRAVNPIAGQACGCTGCFKAITSSLSKHKSPNNSLTLTLRSPSPGAPRETIVDTTELPEALKA